MIQAPSAAILRPLLRCHFPRFKFGIFPKAILAQSEEPSPSPAVAMQCLETRRSAGHYSDGVRLFATQKATASAAPHLFKSKHLGEISDEPSVTKEGRHG